MELRTTTNRYERLLWLGGFILVLFCLALVIDGTLSQTRGGDGPSYLILARSLAEGFGYSDINIPGAPAHTQYPPLLPLLLAPVYLFFGYNFLLVKAVLAVFAAASLFLIRSFFSDEGSRLYGTIIALLTGTNFFFLFYANEILTEIPYLFLSFLALVYAKKHITDGSSRQLLFVLPLILALSYLLRMIGVTLVAAAFFALLLARREGEGRVQGLRKSLLFALAASIPFVLWTARNSIYGQDVATYQSIFAQADYYSLDSGQAGFTALFDRFALNSGYYFEGIYEMLVGLRPGGGIILWAALLAVFLLVMAGFLKELFSRREMKDFYFLFYLGLLTVWPVYGQGDAQRYLVPMLPLLYHYLFVGSALAWDRSAPLRARARMRVAAFCALVLLLGALNWADISLRVRTFGWAFDGAAAAAEGALFREVRSLSISDLGGERLKRGMPCFYNYLAAAESMRAALPDGGVLMARKPEIVYLLLDAPVVRFPYTSDAMLMERFVKEKGVSHVLLDGCYPETESYAKRYIMSRQERFRVLVSDGQGAAALALQ